ncbi:MAG: hypothetical protein R6X31_06920 [Anaerolineae bacterium]
MSTPQAPTVSATSPTTTAGAAAGDRLAATPTPFAPLIVAKGGGDVEAPDRFDVELVSHVETVGAALDVAVEGDYAYVADAEVGLQVVDVGGIRGLGGLTTPLSNGVGGRPPGLAVAHEREVQPDAHGKPPPGRGARARRLTLEDDFVYIAGGSALDIVDVSDPLAPRTAGRLDLGGAGSALDVAVAENHAYVATGTSGVRIIDTSDPSAPFQVGAWIPEHAYVQGLAVADGILYAAASDAGLFIVDVSDPVRPVEKASLEVPLQAWGVELVGNTLFVTWNLRAAGGGPSRPCGSGVTLVGVYDPETPEANGRYCHPSRQGVSDVAVAIVERTMYVAAGDRGVRVLDFSNRNAPIEIGHYDTPGDALSIRSEDDTLYVADGGGGLFVLRYTPNGFPANEDENIRVGISQRSYALSERIEVEIVVLSEQVVLAGPCDWWFERKTDEGWEKVGECQPLSDHEPWPVGQGKRIRTSLPTSRTDRAYHYHYELTPGIYRYVRTYWTLPDSSTIYSPPFEVKG